MTDQSTSLRWDVHVAPPEAMPSGDLGPGEKQTFCSPISATLISGERDAVTVDALLTVGQAHDLAEWITAHDKNLAAVYITHGHGDHWFGLGAVLDRFPDARAFALPAVIEQMRAGSAPGFFELSLPEDEPFDPTSLLFAIDALPPATFDVEFSGWVPTLELTVYVRALPARPGACPATRPADRRAAGRRGVLHLGPHRAPGRAWQPTRWHPPRLTHSAGMSPLYVVASIANCLPAIAAGLPQPTPGPPRPSRSSLPPPCCWCWPSPLAVSESVPCRCRDARGWLVKASGKGQALQDERRQRDINNREGATTCQ